MKVSRRQKLRAARFIKGLLEKVTEHRIIPLQEQNKCLKSMVATHEQIKEQYLIQIQALKEINKIHETTIDFYRQWEKQVLPPHLRLEQEEENKQAA